MDPTTRKRLYDEAVSNALAGHRASQAGNLHESIARFQHAAVLFKQVGELGRAASAWNDVAMDHLSLGDCHAAFDAHRSSFDLYRAAGDVLNCAHTGLSMGAELLEMGRRRDAAKAFQAAAIGFAALGDAEGLARAEHNLAACLGRPAHVR